MPRNSRTKPRLAAAVVLSVTGGLLAVGVPTPAQGGECVAFKAAIYYNKKGWYPIGNEDQNCVGPATPWNQAWEPGAGEAEDVGPLPEGVPTGARFRLFIPTP